MQNNQKCRTKIVILKENSQKRKSSQKLRNQSRIKEKIVRIKKDIEK